MFAVTKALMSQQISHDKKKSKLKQIKQLAWIVCLNVIIFTTNSVQWTSFIYTFITYGKEYNRESPSDQKMFLIINIIQMTLTIAMCIFMFKNFFKPHLQTKVRFLILSIYHLINCLRCTLVILESVYHSNSGIGLTMLYVPYVILNSSLVLVFAKAVFSAPKLNDIWSLEKMTSKDLCFIPNLLFTIVILSSMSFVLYNVLYSLHVFPTYYAH